MITQARLKELFTYSPEGCLVRLVSVTYNAKKGDRAGGLSGGYRYVNVDGYLYAEHRLIFLYHHGYLPKYVDHEDRNKKNNKIKNLRDLTNSQNSINSNVIRSISGYRGVTYHPSIGKYSARLMKDYKNYYLGLYASPEDASAAYEKKRQEMFPDVFGL